jgi:hypothetical protein
MAESLSDVLSYINNILPNGISTENKVIIINDILKNDWKHFTSTAYYTFNTSSSQVYYNLPTNCKVYQIVENGVGVSASTQAVSSTTVYEPYHFIGQDEAVDGNVFFECSTSSTQIGIYPTPDDVYPARIKYQEYPTLFSSTATTTLFNIDQDFMNYVRNKAMSVVAKSGKFPRIDLANNDEMDAKEILRKFKLRKKQENIKTSRYRISYQEGWS